MQPKDQALEAVGSVRGWCREPCVRTFNLSATCGPRIETEFYTLPCEANARTGL